jgi:hypothetical protein
VANLRGRARLQVIDGGRAPVQDKRRRRNRDDAALSASIETRIIENKTTCPPPAITAIFQQIQALAST